MKKSIITLAISIVMITISMAQTSIGVKSSIGVMSSRSSTSYVTTGSDYITHEINYIGSGAVASIGAFAQTKIGYLWVSSELLYTRFNMNYEVQSFLPGDRFNDKQEISETHQYLDIPVTAGVHSNNFRFGVGPVIHILTNLESDFNQFKFYREKTRSLTYGFLGTIGYDLGHLHFDVSYENVFRKLGSHINYNNKKSKFKGSPGHLKVAVGYSF